MSEEENTRIVQEGYENFAKGDVDGLLSRFADDIRWESPAIENAPYTGKRKGLSAVREFFTQLAEAEEINRFEPLEFIAQDEKVVVFGDIASTVNATGRSYESDWVHVFHLHNGKITLFQEFVDSAAVAKAFQQAAAV